MYRMHLYYIIPNVNSTMITICHMGKIVTSFISSVFYKSSFCVDLHIENFKVYTQFL